MQRRHLLQYMAALGVGAHHVAHAATQMVAVRIWPAQEYTRITLESDGPLQYTQFLLDNPPRLAIDITDMPLTATLRELVAKVQASDPNVAKIRVGQFRPDVVRIVVDLKQAVQPQIFSLKPVANYQHRLVFDLYPSNRALDPLEQFLAQMEASGALPPPALAGSESAAAPALTAPAQATGPGGAVSMVDNDALASLLAGHLPPAGTAPATGEAVPALPLPGPQLPAPGSAPASTSAPVSVPEPTPASPPPAVAGIPAPDPDTPTVAPTTPTAGRGRRSERGRGRRPLLIAIDPGHGGEDPGAIGPTGVREKDVVLRISQLLRNRIERSQLDGRPMRVFMTRDSDYLVPLPARRQRARRVRADLFVSIHADAFTNPQANGSSVYVLSQSGASSNAARWLADKENLADQVGGVNLNAYGDDHQVQRVLMNMSLSAQIRDSLHLGNAILAEIGKINRLHKPRVEQANFNVLRSPDMPSVLVETAFISHATEERRLNDPAFQARIADALFRGITQHLRQYAGRYAA